ncbi:septal ring lytic transglycosylase RlpA family protein [Croceicoccus sp. BE223]|uniref:septal ring lytic transglycosylase RlpA family protein n=1 Tax=Croceicoccus sp. BE223 TaxID=2817716 RepID=UPI00285EF755|nr:septal ring lytic transglycosylase RlpA family protein [Croceicoccus sp. BE223]MDR7103518.1 rare lipoprotein A [Croceicoccus sp. BE223]
MQRLAFAFAFAAIAPATAAWAVSDDMTVAEPGFQTDIASPIARQALVPAAPVRVAALAAPAPVVAEAEDEAEPIGAGNASWYGARFAGRPTASGERFNPGGFTAAHRTLPFGSKVKVTSQRTGQSIVVRINDRGPFHGNRLIDLSEAAADAIGIKARGQDRVALTLVSD